MERTRVAKRLTAGIVLSASTLTASASDFIAFPAGDFTVNGNWSTGTVPTSGDNADINNGGTANVHAGDSIGVTRLRLGVSAGQSGSLVMDGGTFEMTNGTTAGDDIVAIGDLGSGTFTMNGGTLESLSGGDFHIGKTGTGVMNMNGGTVNLLETLRVARGVNGPSTGTFNLLGGVFNTGTGVVVARGDGGSTPTGTFVIGGTGKFVAGNSLGEGNSNGFVDEGFFSIANNAGANGHVTVRDTGVVKALRLTGRVGNGDLTIQDDGKFYVVNSLLPGGQTSSNYGSYLGGGGDSNGDHAGGTGRYTLTLKNRGLLDIDDNAVGRDESRGDLQGFILGRGDSVTNANIRDDATLIVRQRLVLGGLGSSGTVSFNGFDGAPSAGSIVPGGTATLTMSGGTLSTDQLVVGGTGSGTFTATGGKIETKAYNDTWDSSANGGAGAANTSVNSIRIGMFAGSTGVMTVSGTATVATGNELSIGHYGTGTLSVGTGAAVAAGGDIAVGKYGMGTLNISGGIVSAGGELAVGRNGNGTLKVTGDGALITVRSVTVQKFAGSTGKLVAEITGAGQSTVAATEQVTINGGTFQVLPTAVPAGAHRWDILTAGTALTGKFTTVSLPADEPGATGRTWSAVYAPQAFSVGLTIYGDADFSGVVNFDDLLALAKNYNKTGAQWTQGEFTRDGVVNFDDLLVLAKHYNQVAPADVPGASAEFDADLAAAFAAVPEPGSIGVAVTGAVLALGRRRRRRS
jgi:T5SS/PEP-CTERM-associated repeat protein